MGQCAPEDSISQCPFLQMIDTAGNPHADGSAAPGARPRHRQSPHSDPPDTSSSHDNWMAARQTSCRQQTAPPQARCSKDVTAHPHWPGARPGRPCQVPARSGQPLTGRSGFSPAFGTEFCIQDSSQCTWYARHGIEPHCTARRPAAKRAAEEPCSDATGARHQKGAQSRFLTVAQGTLRCRPFAPRHGARQSKLNVYGVCACW